MAPRACTPCQAGYWLARMCTNESDTVCRLCEENSFNPTVGFLKQCRRCSPCKRNEYAYKPCTRISDVVCRCEKPNHVYDKFKPCQACPKGTVVINNKCTNTTSFITTQPPPTNNSSSVHSKVIALGIGLGVIAIIVCIIVGLCYYYSSRKRRRHHPPIDDAPSEANEPVIPSEKFPIKLPRTPPRENIYSAIPLNVNTNDMKTKRICSHQLPFSLVHELGGLLAASHSKNYKHLADKLGYKYSFIKRLESQEEPVEALLDDYVTGENPTKEQLYGALLAIGRPDAAKIVMDEL